jgi:hypothetical protein
MNTADFAVDPCGAYKGVTRWSKDAKAHAKEGVEGGATEAAAAAAEKTIEAAASAGDRGGCSPPAKRAKLEKNATAEVAAAAAAAEKTIEAATPAQRGAEADAEPSQKTALGFVHKRPVPNAGAGNAAVAAPAKKRTRIDGVEHVEGQAAAGAAGEPDKTQLQQQDEAAGAVAAPGSSEASAASSAAAAAAAAEKTIASTPPEQALLPDYGAWVIYQQAKREAEAEHAQRQSNRAAARIESKTRRLEMEKRRLEHSHAAQKVRKHLVQPLLVLKMAS